MSLNDKLAKLGVEVDGVKFLENKPLISHIATDIDYLDYLESIRNGSFKTGLSTGFKSLDQFLVHKENTLNVCGGMDNVGKTTVLLYFAMLSAMYHNHSWLIYSSENNVGSLVRKLVEFYWCEEIKKQNELKYNKALQFIKEHFTFIKNEDVFGYSDLELIAKKEIDKKQYYGFIIDPYNSLKGRGGNKHEDDYEILGEMLSFCKKNITIWLNCHVFSTAAREVNADKFPAAPRKSQLEGGNKFANRCHDLIMVHRIPQHPTDWMWTEIHTQKIKETETGGSYTPHGEPYKIRMVNHLTGFVDQTDYNPVLEFHNIKPKEQTIFEKPKELKPNKEFETPKNWYEKEETDSPF